MGRRRFGGRSAFLEPSENEEVGALRPGRRLSSWTIARVSRDGRRREVLILLAHSTKRVKRRSSSTRAGVSGPGGAMRECLAVQE